MRCFLHIRLALLSWQFLRHAGTDYHPDSPPWPTAASRSATTAFSSPAPRFRISRRRCSASSSAGISIVATRSPLVLGNVGLAQIIPGLPLHVRGRQRSRPARSPRDLRVDADRGGAARLRARGARRAARRHGHLRGALPQRQRARVSMAGQLRAPATDDPARTADQRHLVVGHRTRVLHRRRAGDCRRAARRLRQRERLRRAGVPVGAGGGLLRDAARAAAGAGAPAPPPDGARRSRACGSSGATS